MNIDETINNLKKHAGFFEVHHKTTFECWRTDKNGNTQEVEIDILDSGPDVNPNIRYHCIAKTKDGKLATGNPDQSINSVLFGVHWDNLDS